MFTDDQVFDRNRAASAAHARHFIQDGHRICEVMKSEPADNRIKFGPGKRQVVRVRGLEVEVREPNGLAPQLSKVERRVRQTNANNMSARSASAMATGPGPVATSSTR